MRYRTGLMRYQDDPRARELLTDLLMTDGGIDMLVEEIKSVPTSAAAYAFLGTVIKEYGGGCSPLTTRTTDAVRLKRWMNVHSFMRKR